MMSTVAIIPARGGSKGIPRKNLIDFCGRPLLEWSILQAKLTNRIDEVAVSSDSDEILSIAKKLGAKIIERPADISGDRATSESALQHAIRCFSTQPDIIVMLQATSPLRKPDDLERALYQFHEEELDSMFSAAILEDFLIWEKSNSGDLISVNYDFCLRGRRQERLPQYVENGSFYIMRHDVIINGNRLGGKMGMYLMDFWQSFELDEMKDLELLKILFEAKLASCYPMKG